MKEIKISDWSHQIFEPNLNNFEELCLNAFAFQFEENPVYGDYCKLRGITDASFVEQLTDIPFLPVSFFKSHQVLSGDPTFELIFSSSGTTGSVNSQHFVKDLSLYQQSFLTGFAHFFGSAKGYCFLGLLPSYLEREGSSLIYMVDALMKTSGHSMNGFYLNDHRSLKAAILELESLGQPYMLFAVSFALLDVGVELKGIIQNGIVIETGGMKGRRKELVREELYTLIKSNIGLKHIGSEYGMTELLSQAYATDNGMYRCPPWMKVMITDVTNPGSHLVQGKTGLINVIDLANIHSCCFIETADLGRMNSDGTFEVLGRMDNSDIRGCSLLVA